MRRRRRMRDVCVGKEEEEEMRQSVKARYKECVGWN
jgi:hypothetical protein